MKIRSRILLPFAPALLGLPGVVLAASPARDPRVEIVTDMGTIAMARTSYPHSATSQFFINVADNGFLNASQAADGQGYCVFGRVVKGQDVVDKIAEVRTGVKAGMRDVPVKPVTIVSARML